MGIEIIENMVKELKELHEAMNYKDIQVYIIGNGTFYVSGGKDKKFEIEDWTIWKYDELAKGRIFISTFLEKETAMHIARLIAHVQEPF